MALHGCTIAEMLKAVLLSMVLISAVGVRAATVNLSGTVTQECFYTGFPPVPPEGSVFTQTFTGTNITATCPAGYIAPAVSGSISAAADTLSTRVTMTNSAEGLVHDTFQGSIADLFLATGGSGSGKVEFTLDYNWSACQDDFSTNESAAFSFNGAIAWSDSGSRGHHCEDLPLDHHSTLVIDEPITYGIPFTWEEDTSLNGGSEGVYGASISLGVSAALLSGGQLVAIPEPAAPWTCAVALLGIAMYGRRRQAQNV